MLYLRLEDKISRPYTTFAILATIQANIRQTRRSSHLALIKDPSLTPALLNRVLNNLAQFLTAREKVTVS